MAQAAAATADYLLNHIGAITAAIGGLGTAAYGLVDATKSIAFGVSNVGFGVIAKVMATLIPEATPEAAAAASTGEPPLAPALSLRSVLVSLKSNWVNGVTKDDQIAIAKSLVKLAVRPSAVASLAALTGVDATVLASVFGKIARGAALLPEETDVYARFDLIVTTLLEQAYQRADQQYRNAAKVLAAALSVVLAAAGAYCLGERGAQEYGRALLIGLIATPLAPVAKDVASAIQAGAKAVQVWKS
ncbi:hypothetical protein [Terriglobus aquaticus]|uniref:EcsC protein family protein n=1 Tax=Terriglobus aquaticus TaxID=940139 RepID=A0ABW9KQ43_9BACT|nr:hypothetical protein [Terriglobus aquaticus]